MLRIFFLFLFSCQLLASAHSYYVDNIKGNDRNDGLSAQNPWRTLNKVNSNTYNPGDKILLVRDGFWYEQLNLKGSGSPGNPIILSDYGTGNYPIIDAGLSKEHCILLNKNKWVTVSNIQMRNSNHASIRIKYGENIIVDNCNFYVTGHGGVFIEASNNCEIKGNTITTPTGYYNKQTDGIYSQRNNNVIFDNNNVVISNEHPDQHCDGIQSYLDKNIIIRNNYVEQRNNKTGHAQGIYATTMTGPHTYYNNVVYCPNTRSSVMGFRNLKETRGTLKAYHNTLVGGGTNILFVSENAGIDAKNNIFYSTGKSSILRLETSNIILENNLYYHSGTGNVIGYGKGKKSKEVAEVKTEGKELGGIFGDPRLSAAFELQSGSPAIDKGLVLGPPYDVDRNGRRRNNGSGPDIGAYEFIK